MVLRANGVACMVMALVVAALSVHTVSAGACATLSDCSGHGTCDTTTTKCVCYDGWGSSTDVAIYKAPDCSKRKMAGGGGAQTNALLHAHT